LKDFTVTAWIKTSAAGDLHRIISHQDDPSMRQEGVFLGIHSSLDGIGLFHAGPAINDGAFHHVAAVRDTAAGHWFLYVDGIQFVGPSVTNATFNIAEKLQIGRYVGGSEFWQGVLVQMIKTALRPFRPTRDSLLASRFSWRPMPLTNHSVGAFSIVHSLGG
jgi:hypothetical protein